MEQLQTIYLLHNQILFNFTLTPNALKPIVARSLFSPILSGVYEGQLNKV